MMNEIENQLQPHYRRLGIEDASPNFWCLAHSRGRKRKVLDWVILSCMLISGCATIPPPTVTADGWVEVPSGKLVFVPRETNGVSEVTFRQKVGEPDWVNAPANRIGLALSGGGSKSAAFGMGVLAGLDDLDYFAPRKDDAKTPKVAFVSSVSGGSYAAYFLVSQIIANHELGKDGQPPGKHSALEFLFVDALTHTKQEDKVFDEALLAGPYKVPMGADDLGNGLPDMLNRHQSVVRCAQDLLIPGKCSVTPTSNDKLRTWSSNLGMLFPTLLTAPIHHLFNTLFDTGISVAPTRKVYEQGIGLTYGSTPLRAYEAPKERFMLWGRLPCPKQNQDGAPQMINCHEDERGDRIAEPLDFPKLTDAWRQLGVDGSDELPFWVIQATATKYRSIGGWLTKLERDAFDDSFEFTPLSFGSRRYGFVPEPHDSLTVLDATTSSAAFFDANQQVYHKPWQSFIGGVAQHTLNLNWGTDIPNYNVSNARRRLHGLLPLPIAWIDSVVTNAGRTAIEHDRQRSAFIRLVDGGSSENTAAVSALRRGLKTLVVVDAAEDHDGEFADLCFLKRSLEGSSVPGENNKENALALLPHSAGKKVYLHVPGLEKFSEHCLALEKGDKSNYDLGAPYASETPALLACLTHEADEKACPPGQALTRILVIKPMLDFERVEKEWPGLMAGNASPLQRCAQGAFLYTADIPPEDCTKTASEVCKKALPCDVARLLHNYGLNDRQKYYPQTSTVWTTGNSSATLYSAYRELARQIVVNSRPAIEAAVRSEKTFEEKLQEQVGKGLHLLMSN